MLKNLGDWAISSEVSRPTSELNLEVGMKEIVGFEDYLVCKSGKIWSNKSQKFLAGGEDKDGYLMVILLNGAKRYNGRVHRLVAQAYLENPDNLPIVHHKDADKQNNCVDNLEWVTVSHNTKEAYKNGALNQKGENNNSCKYDDTVVDRVIRGYSGGNIAEYARSLGIPYSVVYSYLKKLRRS